LQELFDTHSLNSFTKDVGGQVGCKIGLQSKSFAEF